MNDMSITSERLQALRKARGYSQQDVANLIGVGRTTYLKYENGDNKPTRKINELARLFQVSTDYLLGNADSPSPAPQKSDSLPKLNARDEREIERDLEDMMHSVSTAAYEGNADAQEDVEAFKATLKAAMIQAKRIAKKKYTPRKYQH